MNKQDSIAIDKLLQYLHVDTAQPNPKYELAVDFMKAYASEIPALSFESHKLPSGFPYVLLTWKSSNGTGSSKDAILLNSHMDVVSFQKEQWSDGADPMGSRNKGRIYGRGAQDMKSIAIQQIEAIRRLHEEGVEPQRDVLVLLVPDEEVGGLKGMKELVDTGFFDRNKVALALDEGVPSNDDKYLLMLDERYPLWVNITFIGSSGHGSLPAMPSHSTQKFRFVFNKLHELHCESLKSLNDVPSPSNLGSAITVQLTKISGGAEVNVIPTKVEAKIALT